MTDRDLLVVEGLADSVLLRVVLVGRALDRTWLLEELEDEGRLRFASLDRFPAERAQPNAGCCHEVVGRWRQPQWAASLVLLTEAVLPQRSGGDGIQRLGAK